MSYHYLKNFTETEKRGLLGKIISFFDIRTYYLRDGVEYNRQDFTIKRLKTYFTPDELKFIYKKIMECEKPHFIVEKIPLLTPFRIYRIFEYLDDWRSEYFKNKDMSGFLCGAVGNIRRRREQTVTDALDIIKNKTNADMKYEIQKYLGGKQLNKTKNIKKQRGSHFRKTQKNGKRKCSAKNKHL